MQFFLLKIAGSTWESRAIAAVIGLALVARLINLNAGLWYDEILTLTQSVRLPPATLIETYGSLNNHVLYTWLAKAFVALGGEQAWVLRTPAVIFGVASVGAAWLAFRETGFRWAAIAAAALLAVSYHHVWFSQNARGYTGLLLFTTLAGWALHRAVTTSERRYWFYYAAFFASAMLVHLSAAFLLLAHGLTLLIHGAIVARKRAQTSFWGWLAGPLIGFGLGALVVLVVFAPMIGGMVSEFSDVAGSPGETAKGVAEWKSPVWTMIETVKSFGVLGLVMPIAAVFSCIGIWRMLRSAPWIAAPYLIQIPLTFVILTILSMRVWPRYFFIDIAFVMTAVVLGAFAFADFVAHRLKLKERLGVDATALKIAGVAVMAAISIPLLVRNYERPKQDFDGALALLQAQAAADEVTTLGLASLYFNDYRDLRWRMITTEKDLTVSADARRLWVVAAFPAHAEAHFPDATSMLRSEFDEVARFEGTLSGGDIVVYRSREQ